MILFMTAFASGLQIALDTKAGERDQGLLEPLLTNPGPRVSVVARKWLAPATFSFTAVAATDALGGKFLAGPALRIGQGRRLRARLDHDVNLSPACAARVGPANLHRDSSAVLRGSPS